MLKIVSSKKLKELQTVYVESSYDKKLIKSKENHLLALQEIIDELLYKYLTDIAQSLESLEKIAKKD